MSNRTERLERALTRSDAAFLRRQRATKAFVIACRRQLEARIEVARCAAALLPDRGDDLDAAAGVLCRLAAGIDAFDAVMARRRRHATDRIREFYDEHADLCARADLAWHVIVSEAEAALPADDGDDPPGGA